MERTRGESRDGSEWHPQAVAQPPDSRSATLGSRTWLWQACRSCSSCAARWSISLDHASRDGPDRRATAHRASGSSRLGAARSARVAVGESTEEAEDAGEPLRPGKRSGRARVGGGEPGRSGVPPLRGSRWSATSKAACRYRSDWSWVARPSRKLPTPVAPQHWLSEFGWAERWTHARDGGPSSPNARCGIDVWLSNSTPAVRGCGRRRPTGAAPARRSVRTRTAAPAPAPWAARRRRKTASAPDQGTR